MEHSFLEVSLTDARTYIEQLNLDYIVETMCSASYPLPRWTLSDAEHCCRLYKNFLLLQKIHFTEHLVPTREMDEFWHNHILHTNQYITDCLNIFGRYLHHTPFSPSDNKQDLINRYQKTKDYYFEEFKIPIDLIK
jgi:hypothetical protein